MSAAIIFEHRVDITDGTGIIKDSDGYVVTPLHVVAESEKEIVVQGTRYGHFVVVRKAKCEYQTCLDVESIGLSTADSVWGNRVSYLLYATKQRRASTVRAAIERAIQKKFGFFIAGINLDSIVDK